MRTKPGVGDRLILLTRPFSQLLSKHCTAAFFLPFIGIPRSAVETEPASLGQAPERTMCSIPATFRKDRVGVCTPYLFPGIALSSVIAGHDAAWSRLD